MRLWLRKLSRLQDPLGHGQEVDILKLLQAEALDLGGTDDNEEAKCQEVAADDDARAEKTPWPVSLA